MVEVLRWFNMTMLEDFWDLHLHSDSDLMALAATLSLKHSIVHSVTLQKILQHPPKTWQVTTHFTPVLSSSFVSTQYRTFHTMVSGTVMFSFCRMLGYAFERLNALWIRYAARCPPGRKLCTHFCDDALSIDLRWLQWKR